MTWQGGKKVREARPVFGFARLRPMATGQDDAAQCLMNMAQALSSYRRPVRIHVSLVTGTEDAEHVEHWDIQSGIPGATALRAEPKDADVTLAMRPETFTMIAQGRLAPYEAVFDGKIRVGGDVEVAKAVTRHLTDPEAKYVSPC